MLVYDEWAAKQAVKMTLLGEALLPTDCDGLKVDPVPETDLFMVNGCYVLRSWCREVSNDTTPA